MFGLTFNQGIVLAAVLVVVAMVALFLIDMRKRGRTPAQELAAIRADPRAAAAQAGLQAGDLADHVRDLVTAQLREWAAKTPAPTLKSGYYDKENFDRDIGVVLKAGGQHQMVRLDGAVKIDGDEPAIDYYLQPNGNVTTKPPA